MTDAAFGVTLEELTGPLDGPYEDDPGPPYLDPRNASVHELPQLDELPARELVRSPTGKIHVATHGWAYAPPWDAVVGSTACGHDVWIPGTAFAPGSSIGYALHPSTHWKREPFEQLEVAMGQGCRKCFRGAA